MAGKTFALSLMATMAAARSTGIVSNMATRTPTNNPIKGFEYVGCVKAEPSAFDMIVDFFGPFTSQDCQHACQGSGSYAALGDGCRCDVAYSDAEPVEYEMVDEKECYRNCIEDDDAAGNCGGDADFYTLFKRIENEKREDCEEHEDMNAAAAAAEPAPAPPAEPAPAPAPPAPAPPAEAAPAAAPPPPAVKVAVAPSEDAKPKPVIEVVHECPEDCEEHGGEKLSLKPVPEESCPPGGCAEPAAAPPAPNAKIVVDCPPEGCAVSVPVTTPTPAPAPAKPECGPNGCDAAIVVPPPVNKAAPACNGIDCIVSPPAPAPTPIGTPLPVPVCPGPECQQSTTLTRAATPTEKPETENTGSESGPVSGSDEETPSFNGGERGVVVSWTPIVVTALLAAIVAL